MKTLNGRKGATFFPRKPPLHNRARNNRERVRQRQRARETRHRERKKRVIMGNLAKGASSLVGSPALVAAMLAFTIAQICKVFTHYHTTGKVDWGRLVGSGGMPSSHTALVVGLTTAIGLKDALDSSIFALCLVFSLVVSKARLGFCFSVFRRGLLDLSFPSLCFDHTRRVLKERRASLASAFLKPSSLSNPLSLLVFCNVKNKQVMYDATGVRLHAGRQAEVLNQLIVELPRDHPLTDSRPLRDSLGHTPVQVAVGALLGMVVGYAHFNMWLISQGVDL